MKMSRTKSIWINLNFRRSKMKNYKIEFTAKMIEKLIKIYKEDEIESAFELFLYSGRHTLKMSTANIQMKKSFGLNWFQKRRAGKFAENKVNEFANHFIHNEEDLQRIHMLSDEDILEISQNFAKHGTFTK